MVLFLHSSRLRECTFYFVLRYISLFAQLELLQCRCSSPEIDHTATQPGENGEELNPQSPIGSAHLWQTIPFESCNSYPNIMLTSVGRLGLVITLISCYPFQLLQGDRGRCSNQRYSSSETPFGSFSRKIGTPNALKHP